MAASLLSTLVMQSSSVVEPFSVVDSCFVITTPSGSLGTGFLVDDGLVVTAAHVVGDSKRVSLVTSAPASQKYFGDVVLADSNLDIAVISVADPLKMPVLDFTATSPEIGNVVYAVGSPVGGLVESRGSVLRILPTRIESDTPIDSGSSGGPLFNVRGQVEGVVVQMNEITRHAFSVPSSVVSKVVKRAQNVPTQSPTRASVPPSVSTLSNLQVLIWITILILFTMILALIIGITHGKSRPKRIVITLDKE